MATFLENEKVRFVPVTTADAEWLYELQFNAATRSLYRIVSPKNYDEFVESFKKGDQSKVDFIVIAKSRSKNDVVKIGTKLGIIGLNSISYINGSAWIGGAGLEEVRGHGYGTSALELMLTYAFKELRLHRIVAGAISGNIASQAVLEKLGFVKEGTQRECIFNGKYIDSYLYSMLSTEFAQRKYKDKLDDLGLLMVPENCNN